MIIRSELWFGTLVLLGVACIVCGDNKEQISKHDYLLNHVFRVHKVKESIDAIPPSDESNKQPMQTFLDYYEDGVQAYLANDWEECIENMEKSIAFYHEYYDTTAYCRIVCEFEGRNHKPLNDDDFEGRLFFERMIVKTICIEKCKQKQSHHLPTLFSLDDESKEIFLKRKPYDYLQLCYYQNGQVQLAISATYTVLVVDPGNQLALRNIKFYTTLEQFDIEKIEDLEAKKFSEYYEQGLANYGDGEWLKCIDYMELALSIWFEEYAKCRAFCEGDFNAGWNADFVTSVANHYVYTIRCKLNCTKELSYLNGRYYDDFLPSIFEYLQYSYFQVGKIREAVECTASYTLLNPKSEDMKANIKFYEGLPEFNVNYLKPRKIIQDYYSHNLHENELIAFVERESAKLF